MLSRICVVVVKLGGVWEMAHDSGRSVGCSKGVGLCLLFLPF